MRPSSRASNVAYSDMGTSADSKADAMSWRRRSAGDSEAPDTLRVSGGCSTLLDPSGDVVRTCIKASQATIERRERSRRIAVCSNVGIPALIKVLSFPSLSTGLDSAAEIPIIARREISSTRTRGNRPAPANGSPFENLEFRVLPLPRLTDVVGRDECSLGADQGRSTSERAGRALLGRRERSSVGEYQQGPSPNGWFRGPDHGTGDEDGACYPSRWRCVFP